MSTVVEQPAPLPLVCDLSECGALLTVEQVQRMTEAGHLPEEAPFELLDGVLVFKDRGASGDDSMMFTPAHTRAVHRLARLVAPACENAGFVVRRGDPVILSPRSAPEPDLAIVDGPESRYDFRHAEPPDVRIVFEVSDHSLRSDRRVKSRLYAKANLATYLIVNLRDRQFELYTQPVPAEERYAGREVIPEGKSVPLEVAPGVMIDLAVDDVLGPPEIPT